MAFEAREVGRSVAVGTPISPSGVASGVESGSASEAAPIDAFAEASIATAAGAPSEARTGSVFLGRRMVALAALANFLSSTVTLGAFGTFVGPVAADFDVPRSTIGLGVAFTILAIGLVAPVVGRLLDGGRARTMMGGGALVTAIGLLLLSQAEALWQAAVAFVGFVCVGSAFFGMVPSMALVTNWYERRRGLALGFAVAGGTFATYLAPTAGQALIDAFGWRTAVAVLGGATLLVAVPLFAGFVVGRPEQIGQRPDGDDPRGAGAAGDRPDSRLASASGSRGLAPVGTVGTARTVGTDGTDGVDEAAELPGMLPTSALARDGRLWLLAFGFGAVMTSPVVLMGLLVEYGRDLGFSAYQTAGFFGAMIPFSLLGKLVVGGLADVAPLKPSIAMTVVVNMAIWGIFTLEPSYPAFLATGALYGIGIGGATPLQGVAIAACFGRANFGRANGLGAILAVPLLAGASALSHLLEGATGSYQAAFLVQAALIGAGGVALGFVRFPERRVTAGSTLA